MKVESPRSPKSSSKSPRTSPKSLPLDQVRLVDVDYGFISILLNLLHPLFVLQTQEERLSNDLLDIMREANILEELDGEKMEQENLEALKSIEGEAAASKKVDRNENLTADEVEEVDVEGVWSPRQLIQVFVHVSTAFLVHR